MSARARTGDAGAISEVEFEDSFAKVPEILPLNYKDLDKLFQEISKTLQNEASNWTTTCQALVKIRSFLKYGGIDNKTIAQKLYNIQDVLRQSVVSLRSQVARDASITVAFASVHLGQDFRQQAEGLLVDLLKMSGVSTKIMATSAITALKYVVKFIKDHNFLQILSEELKNNKSKLIRASVCLALLVIVEEWPAELLQRHAQIFQQALEKGASDADPTARKHSREAIEKANAKIPGFSSSINTRAIPSSRSAVGRPFIPLRAKSDMSVTKLRQPMSAASRIPSSQQRKQSGPSMVAAGSGIPTKSQPSSRNASPKRQRLPQNPSSAIQQSASSSSVRSRVLNERRMNEVGSAAVPPRPQNGFSNLHGDKSRTPQRQISEPKMQHNRIRSPSPPRNGDQVGRRTPSALRQPAIGTPSKLAQPIYRPQPTRGMSQLTSQMSGMSVGERMNTADQVQDYVNKTEPRADGSAQIGCREALDRLANMVADQKVVQWDAFFSTMFPRALDYACDRHVDLQVRCAAVRLLRAFVRNKRGINQRIHHLVTSTVNTEVGEVALSKELEDLNVEIARSCDLNLVMPILLNQVRATRPDEPSDLVCARLRMLPHVLYNTDPDHLDRLVDDLVPVLCEMDTLVRKLREVFEDDEVDVDEVQRLLEAYSSDKADWKKYAHFDPHKYTRNLVDAGNGKYNLLVLCWPSGLGSNIHDHTNSHCFVKVLDGTMRETRFAWPEQDQTGPMKETRQADAQTNDVTYMSDDLGLHRMENPSHVEGAVSLHLYVPPYQDCQIFDQRTGVRQRCNVTFYTKYGRKVDYRGAKEGKTKNNVDISAQCSKAG